MRASQHSRFKGLALLVVLSRPALAQQYPFIPVPGSPREISALFQDSPGRIWMMGSPPSVFDGARFYSLEDYGLPRNSRIHMFAESPDGAVWIAAVNGLFRYFRGHIEQIAKGEVTSVKAPVPDMAIVTMDGTLENRMVVRFRFSKRWNKEPVFPLDSPGPLSFNRRGTALAVWPYKGAVEFRIADVVAWRAGTPPPELAHIPDPTAPGNGTLKAMRDSYGCLWFAVDGFNSNKDCPALPKNSWIALDNFDMNPDMHETPDGGLILWGESIIAVRKAGQWQRALAANGLPVLTDTLESRDSGIWLGTRQGLYRFPAPFRLSYWNLRQGDEAQAWSFARIGDRMFAGLVDRIAVLSHDKRNWETFADRSTFSGHIERDITALLPAHDGNLLAASQYGKVRLFSSSGRVLAATRLSEPAGGYMRLSRGQGEEVWLGGDDLGTLRQQASDLVFTPIPVPGEPPRALRNLLSISYREDTQSLWACYKNGILMRDAQDQWHKYTTKEGLLENGCQSLIALPDGALLDKWWASPTLGLIHLQPGGRMSVRNFTASDIEDPTGGLLELDRQGRIWRGGSAATFVATPQQAEAGQWLRLDENDGFHPDLRPGSFFADTDGSIWAGSGNDIFHYTPPADLTQPQFAPEIFLSSWSVDNAPPRLADSLPDLPPGTFATAHIGTLQFDRRSALRLRYRLSATAGWTETRSLDIPLGDLGSGAHTLEVQGRIYTGPWSKTLRHGFLIRTPAWRTTPWLLTYLASSLLFVTGFIAVRRHQVAQEAKLMPNQANARVLALRQGVGDVLDSRFEVGMPIAKGGFANVMYGFDRQTARPCAIKIFHDRIGTEAWRERRFEQEVAALSRICHPNVVAVHAHGQVPTGALWLAMELVEGPTLSQVLSEGPIPPARAGRILRDIAGALHVIHAQGICHRDVKPDNIMLRRREANTEQSVLIDFSVAIVKDADSTFHGLSLAAGTLRYMAPEQILGFADEATDIYSLARVTIEMITGQIMTDLLPYAALDLSARLRELLQSWGHLLSEESIEMLASAQEFDPAKRPHIVAEFAAPVVRDLLEAEARAT